LVIDGDVVASVPIKAFSAATGWLQFTVPTWAFGAISRDLVYDALGTSSGEGIPERFVSCLKYFFVRPFICVDSRLLLLYTNLALRKIAD
jgi:hypothetical protein